MSVQACIRVPEVDSSSLLRDVSALRQHVTRPSLAKALWAPGQREAILQALQGQFGDSSLSMSRWVTLQALNTAVTAVRDAFQTKEIDFVHVLEMVELIASFDQFMDHALKRVLMPAYIHVTSHLLPTLDTEALKMVYRRTVDFLRKDQWSGTPELESVQKLGIEIVKAVTKSVFYINQNGVKSTEARVAAQVETKGFHEQFPLSRLQEALQEQTHRTAVALVPVPALKMNNHHKSGGGRSLDALASLNAAMLDNSVLSESESNDSGKEDTKLLQGAVVKVRLRRQNDIEPRKKVDPAN